MNCLVFATLVPLLLIGLLKRVLNKRVNGDTCTERTRDTSHKYGLPGVQRLRSIHHKITVIQVPWADLDLSHMKPESFSSRNKLH